VLILSSKEETKGKSLFHKIETKLGFNDDAKIAKDGKPVKEDKKTSRRPRSERDSIMISRPTSTSLKTCCPHDQTHANDLVGMVHKTHVDREFQWTGENADRAFQLEQKVGGGCVWPQQPVR